MTQALESKRNERSDPAHYADSSVRENLIEHVFLGELLRGLWRKNVRDLEVLRPEVDSGAKNGFLLEYSPMTLSSLTDLSRTPAMKPKVN